MNEQLKEFAYESGLLSKRVFDDSWVDNPKLEAKLKKFSELLVEECMEQVWYTREDGINGNVSEVIKDRIKKHFGVEE